MRIAGRWWVWSFVAAGLLLAGCGSPSYNPTGEKSPPIPELAGSGTGGIRNTNPIYRLRHGDELLVNFPDAPPGIQPITDTVKEDGTITLIYNQKFEAADKTISELQTNIHNRYVTSYFRVLTVNIKIMNRTYSVGGEVRAPGNFGYNGQTKILDAINSCGGFTDFASHTVLLTRADGTHEDVDCDKARKDPKLNKEIFPGDSVFVRKRIW